MQRAIKFIPVDQFDQHSVIPVPSGHGQEPAAIACTPATVVVGTTRGHVRAYSVESEHPLLHEFILKCVDSSSAAAPHPSSSIVQLSFVKQTSSLLVVEQTPSVSLGKNVTEGKGDMEREGKDEKERKKKRVCELV